ncbi:uncharacterized protein YbjQ (UPF0145 family) [Luteimonas sp. 3794]|nr:uncharacterized protein YbjQ (UPF0145 family) [Luteimonas sp. 3794]
MGDVSGAVDTIQDRMSYGFTDWVISDQDVRDSMAALAELTPSERNEVVSQLDDKALERLTGNAEELSANERQDVYENLVDGLDGAQIARLATTFGGSDRIGRVDFADAVASHATPEAKLAFIEATKGSIDGAYSAMQGQDGNPETLAIAKVLASLSGDQAAFDTAIKSLSEGQLEDVLAVGLGRNYYPAGNTGFYSFDPSASLGILSAATNSTDLQVKGAVFEAATAHFNTVDGQALDSSYLDAISGLVESDPSGLVNELQARTDLTGESLTAYTKEMLESGREEDLRNLVVQMQQGNDGAGNAFENFSDPAFARNLGFLSGSIAAAINSTTDDAEAQGNMLKNIFGTAFGVSGAANPAAGVIASVGNGITSTVIDGIVDRVSDGNKDLKQALYELAIPRDAGGSVNMSGTGYDAFNASYAAIAQVND